MSNVSEELYSLLIPMAGSRLIVPRVCVAEVSGLGQLNLLDHGPEARGTAQSRPESRR